MYVTANCSLSISNTTFKNNIAEGFTGAMCSHNSSVNIEHVNFENNYVLNKLFGSGGGLWLHKSSMTKISNVLFSKCHANQGGAIAANSSTIIMSKCSVIENTGSAIFLLDSDSLEINNSIFFNNSTPYKGGAIMCSTNCLVKTIETRFSHNRAVNRGGAVNLVEKSNFTAEKLLIH